MRNTGKPIPQPAQAAGQYGTISAPDLTQERAEIRTRVAEFGRGVDELTGYVLDPQVDAQSRRWRGEIAAEYEHRVTKINDRIGALRPELSKRQVVVTTLQQRHAMLKADYDRAHLKLTGFPPPPAAVDDGESTRSLTLRSEPPVAVHRVDDARAFPGMGHTGGLSIGDYMHYGVLALAGLADFVAFYQVLALVLGGIPEMLYVVVLAVSFAALALMHQTGKTLREFRARYSGGRAWVALVCASAWAALGVSAYVLRLKVGDDAGSGAVIDFGGVQIGDNDTSVQTKAMVFGIIYLVTGVIALVGAYLTWNPIRREFKKAERRFNRISRKLDKARAAAEEIRSQQEQLQAEVAAEDRKRDAAYAHRAALACELKAYVREEIAKILQDPEATQTLLEQPIPGCGGDAASTPRSERASY